MPSFRTRLKFCCLVETLEGKKKTILRIEKKKKKTTEKKKKKPVYPLVQLSLQHFGF